MTDYVMVTTGGNPRLWDLYETATGSASSYTANTYNVSTGVSYVTTATNKSASGRPLTRILNLSSADATSTGDYVWLTSLPHSSLSASGSALSSLYDKSVKIRMSGSSIVVSAGNVLVEPTIPETRLMLVSTDGANVTNWGVPLTIVSSAIQSSSIGPASYNYGWTRGWVYVRYRNPTSLILTGSAEKIWKVEINSQSRATFVEKEPFRDSLYPADGAGPTKTTGLRRFTLPAGCTLYSEGWSGSSDDPSINVNATSWTYSAEYEEVKLSSLFNGYETDSAYGKVVVAFPATVSAFNSAGVSKLPEEIYGVDPVVYVYNSSVSGYTAGGSARMNFDIGQKSSYDVIDAVPMTAETTSTASQSSTSTSTEPVWYYSPVYSSTATTARCYEQIFLEETDPAPFTPDCTNFITSVNVGEWDEVCFSGFGYTTNEYGYMTAPLFRAYLAPSSYSELSAYVMRDGYPVNWYNSRYDPIKSSWLCSASSTWIPMTSIVGSGDAPCELPMPLLPTGTMLVSFAVHPAFYSADYPSSPESSRGLYKLWQRGGLKELPDPRDMLSGMCQFRKSATGIGTSTTVVTIPINYTSVTASSEYLQGITL